jgi:hypothetical protein
MDGLIIFEREQRVYHAERWGWVLKLPKDRSAMDIVQKHIEFI